MNAPNGVACAADVMAGDGQRRDDSCEFCDEPGGPLTYRHQVCMPIGGRVQCIDRCIHQIVAALNAGGVRTVASCCGHAKREGNIFLEDGRLLLIRSGEAANSYGIPANSDSSRSSGNSGASQH